jgi:hypothetical protein
MRLTVTLTVVPNSKSPDYERNSHMTLIIILAAALILGLSVFALTSTNGKLFVQRNFKYFLALSALLAPAVVILSACQSLE